MKLPFFYRLKAGNDALVRPVRIVAETRTFVTPSSSGGQGRHVVADLLTQPRDRIFYSA